MGDRRSFLKGLLIFFSTISFPALLLGKSSGRKKVIVAGGGFAGLYAADLLKKKGYSVLLLESSHRMGGKALGGSVAQQTFDLGCQAFSKDMHRVKKLGKRFQLTVIPKPPQKEFFFGANRILTRAELLEVQKAFQAIEEAGRALYAGLEISEKRDTFARTSVFDWVSPQLSALALPFFSSGFSAEWCAHPKEVSMLHYLEYQRGFDVEGEEMDFRFREGLFRAAEGLARELSNETILSCPLEKISVKKNGVTAIAGGQSFDAQFLVSAIPLTNLKNIQIEGVESSQLKQALDSVRGAAVRKIIVVYDQPFWGDLPREGIFDPPCGMEIMENSDLEAKRYSLVVFLGGPAADKGMSKENMLLRLSSLLGSGALQPIGFHEQVWLGDEHLCGGYAANRAPGSKFSMAIPSRLGDRIFIAGSDASREFPSYVEGALYGAEKAVAGIVKMQLRIDESMG